MYKGIAYEYKRGDVVSVPWHLQAWVWHGGASSACLPYAPFTLPPPPSPPQSHIFFGTARVHIYNFPFLCNFIIIIQCVTKK